MVVEANETFITSLRAAVRMPLGDGGNLAMSVALKGRHPADIAESMKEFTFAESLAVFNWLDNARAAEVLDELDGDLKRYILDNAPASRIGALLDRLPMDDAAEVVADATPQQAEALLADLTRRAPEDAAEVRELLSYPEGSAGRLMTDKFVRLSADMTVEDAFAEVRRADSDVETVTDLYVVQRDGDRERLSGVLSLRELVRARSTDRIGNIYIPEPITVTVDTEQQEVARLIAKYDFLALPVLDTDGYLVGIITVDDVIDVLIEEFNEDYMRLVGSDAEEMDRRTPAQVAKMRLPWLLGTMGIELIAGLVIAGHSNVLKIVPLLASFMPVISAISGNVGLQAAAISVRGLSTGHVTLNNRWSAVRKELLASLMMALVCGTILGTVGALWQQHLPFGLVIGGAMICSMVVAGLMGTVIPMVSKRLGFDPATTAGPFETAFQDVIGFGVFLWLASELLHWLQ